MNRKQLHKALLTTLKSGENCQRFGEAIAVALLTVEEYLFTPVALTDATLLDQLLESPQWKESQETLAELGFSLRKRATQGRRRKNV